MSLLSPAPCAVPELTWKSPVWEEGGLPSGSCTTGVRQGKESLAARPPPAEGMDWAPEGAGLGLVLCCAPVTDQSTTRDKVTGRSCIGIYEIDGMVGNRHLHKLQRPSDHLPPLLDCPGPHWLPAPPGDTVSPWVNPQPSTTMIT